MHIDSPQQMISKKVCYFFLFTSMCVCVYVGGWGGAKNIMFMYYFLRLYEYILFIMSSTVC